VKYYHDEVGFNSRLDALQAAVLRVKLRYLDEWTSGRSRNAARYTALFRDRELPVVTPALAAYQTRHVWNQYVVRCRERDALRKYLSQEGIGTEVYYPVPLHLQTCFRELGYKRGDFPVSEQLAEESLALPVYAELSIEEVEMVFEAIARFYR
jgi:dTDP-4-amino-4,6-dideoxygalactose transaminase